MGDGVSVGGGRHTMGALLFLHDRFNGSAISQYTGSGRVRGSRLEKVSEDVPLGAACSCTMLPEASTSLTV